MALDNNLFYMVMEADGDEMQAFDPNAELPADTAGGEYP